MIKKFALALLITVFAAAGSVAAQSITQGYDADDILQRGMIVALKRDDSRKVEAVNSSRQDDVHGVVVTGNDATITISEENQKVLVATSGKYEVLVTDLNGLIAEGDYVAVSPVSGVGMKSDDKQGVVIGKALHGFTGSGERFVGRINVGDEGGGQRTVNLGRIGVDLVIGKNPFAGSSSAPLVLRRIGEAVAGEPVSETRIFFALGILIAATGASSAIIYSAVRHGIISIGRNPLSKKSISRSMFQMIVIAFIVFFSALFGVYLVLKL